MEVLVTVPLTGSDINLTEMVTEIAPRATSEWGATEFADLDLGDARREARLRRTAAQLLAQPQAPINQASADWAATKASYRLFQNEHVPAAAILAPHQHRTGERMAGQPVVLALQDTSYLNYTAHPATTGLGPIGTTEQDIQGLLMHTTLALTPAGLPLGVLTQDIWAREPAAPPLTPAERAQRPIEEKESYKWLQALRQTVALQPPDTQLVTVCDREADVYEFFAAARTLHTDILVRAAQDRAIQAAAQAHLWAQVAAAPVAGHLKIEVPAQEGRSARTARATVQFRAVTLRPPWRPPRPETPPLPEITIYAVLVQEIDPPADGDCLEWLLLTTVPVHTFAEAVERVQWYRARWHIEVYFKVLKSGCQVEACRLGTAARLIRYLTLSSIIAWRLYWLTHINRCQPEAPCTMVLATHEWQALYATIHRTTTAPAQLPTVRQTVRWIARLGGFLGRKGDGEPGVTVIWRGWQRLHDIATTWLLAQQSLIDSKKIRCG